MPTAVDTLMRFLAMFRKPIFVLIAIVVVSSNPVEGQIKTDFLMESDPKLPEIPRVREFQLDHSGIWLKALQRPEADLQRMAAESIALGVEKKIPKLEATIPALESIVSVQESHPTARFAAARALIALNSRNSASQLFEASLKHGAEFRQLVEPTLAEWDFVPIREIWNERLQQANVRSRDLILAIRGIGRVGDRTALPRLLVMVLDLVRTAEIRLAAADAVGFIEKSGLESHAERLTHTTAASRVVNRLCAGKLLSHHDSAAARQLLMELATDDEPSIAGMGLHRLNQIDSNLVLPLVERSIKSVDAFVREEAATAYMKLPTIERMQLLAPLLDDPHSGFRKRLCQKLDYLARTPELGDSIRRATMDVLSRDSWRGQEQAAILLGALEFHPASKRLLELLESPRPEVAVASSWSLRKIADPETVPAICDKIRRQILELRASSSNRWVDFQVAHLFEACGKMKAMQAREQMLEFIPKSGGLYPAEHSRCAAIWSIGWLYEQRPDPKIGELLIGRYLDMDLFPPESGLVKQFSVVSLARMNAREYGPELAKAAREDLWNLRLCWAAQQLTGEELPLPDSVGVGPGPSFLDPLDRIERIEVPE